MVGQGHGRAAAIVEPDKRLHAGGLGQLGARDEGRVPPADARAAVAAAVAPDRRRECRGTAGSTLEGDDAGAFMAEFGFEDCALDRIIRESYRLLGSISFFTVGSDECRAWSIRTATPAVEAGGVIHSDIQRGFIRAERFTFDRIEPVLADSAIAGFMVNEARVAEALERNPILVTALNREIGYASAAEIAKRARGTPRIVNRLLRRVRDYAQVKADNRITRDLADQALNLLDIDSDGLPEVVINSKDGYVHAWNADGSYVSGWPVQPVVPAGVVGHVGQHQGLVRRVGGNRDKGPAAAAE